MTNLFILSIYHVDSRMIHSGKFDYNGQYSLTFFNKCKGENNCNQ